MNKKAANGRGYVVRAGARLAIVLMLCVTAGCESAFKDKAAPVPVRVERENEPEMTPAQRADAYRNAFSEGLRLVGDRQFGLAIGAFETALDLRTDSAEAMFNLGACHEAIGDPLRAVNYYRRVLESNPDDADCYRNMGTSFIKLYVREKSPAWKKMAQDAWRRSLALRPDQPDVKQYLAQEPAMD